MEASCRTNEKPDQQSPAISVARQNDVELLGQPLAAVQPAVRAEAKPQGGKPTGKINVKNVMQLLEHQGYQCTLTGRSLTPEVASLDHIVPVRDGGEHVIENTQVLHRDINRAKSILSNEDFIQMCREVTAFAE
ncbi:HNH endonuclease [Rubripirellula lacrimiformis]|uniref:HNH endonuclease n=1 Tax=Rubripirellula lacrimiformis TaxID=1930273 RepID=A0A517NDJ3_9BACT|nr:HNH endonuclease signature motif containing protein [Rubripirellula lacrimiformis]QDT05210.1 HNH endonuclease [Rubripirellula lacrimiformis]